MLNNTQENQFKPEIDAETSELILDFSSVPEQELVPNGIYPAEICYSQQSTAKTSGVPQFVVRYRIIEGEFAGRQITDIISAHPNRVNILRKQLKVLGFEVTGTLRLTPSDFIGRMANISVGTETSANIDPTTGEAYEPRNRILKLVAYAPSVDELPF